MKQKITFKKLCLNSALAGSCALALFSTPAMAGFVDKDHSPEGVRSSATMYTGTPQKSMGFIDYDHSAEGRPSGGKSNDTRTVGNCGFLDCDHSPSGMKS